MLRTQCQTNPRLQERLVHAIRQRAHHNWVEDLCHLAPMLIELLGEQHDRPVDQTEPAIRALLREHSRVTADPIFFDPRAFDRHVRMLLVELESLRREQLEEGEWSDCEVPPQMFG